MTEELLTNAYIKGASDLLQGKIEGMPNVVVIPDNATNGDMVKAITGEDFSRGASIYNHDLMICEGEYYLAFNIDWWNAPYKGSEGKE